MRDVGKVRLQSELAVRIVFTKPKKKVHRIVKHFLMSLSIVVDLLQELIEKYAYEVNLEGKVLKLIS